MTDLDQYPKEAPGGVADVARRDSAGYDGDPEVIEVDVERLGVRPSAARALGSRLWNAVGPVVLAMILDVGDFATSGPLGFIGIPVGLLLGYLFCGFLKVSPTWRIAITMLTGIYMTMPFTGMIPIATITAAVVQVVAPGKLQEEPFGTRR